MKTNASPSRLMALPLFAIAALLIACSSNASSAPSPTNTPNVPANPTAVPATPTAVPAAPTPVPDDCPLDSAVCQLARDLDERLAAGDYSGIANQFSPQPVVCPVRVPSTILLCEGVPDGVSTDAFQLARRYSEGILAHRGGVADALTGFVRQINSGATDAYGNGGLRLTGVSCAEGTPTDCKRAAIIFTAILGSDGQTRREILFFWLNLPADANQPFDGLWDGIVLGDEEEAIFETGGKVFDLGTVFVLN